MNHLKVRQPKAIIFDWDETLVNTKAIITDAIQNLFMQYNISKQVIEQYQTKRYNSLKDVFPWIFGEEWKQAQIIFYDYYLKHHLSTLRAFEQAENNLKFFTENNIKLAIISNKKGEILRKEVNYLQWDKYFTEVIGSLDLIEDKPSAGSVFKVMESMDIREVDKIWFIGDSDVDMDCANNAGCIPVLYGKVSTIYNSVNNHQELLKLFLASIE